MQTVARGEIRGDWRVGSYQISNRNNVLSLVSEKTLKAEERILEVQGLVRGPGLSCCL